MAQKDFDRDRVLAYRAAAQGLHRADDDIADLAVLDLGVQDTPVGSAAHALANRLSSPPENPAAEPGLVTTWTLRGAPHVHRQEDLEPLARALWPWNDVDALTRLNSGAAQVNAAEMGGLAAWRVVAVEMAKIVDGPMPKGEVSTLLTPRVPAGLTVDCRRCKATHVHDSLFRVAVLPAGITFVPGESTVTFQPVPGWPGVPEESAGPTDLIASYLRLLGPATRSEVAAFIGTRAGELAAWWPEEAVEVSRDGTRAFAMPDSLEQLADPPDPPDVRLLPPSDPLMQARDRELLVPDAGHRKILWPVLGKPGALLVAGDVAGSWRARRKGRKVEVEVQPFRRLSAAQRRATEREAELLAASRGASSAEVSFES